MKKLFRKIFGVPNIPIALPIAGLCKVGDYTWEQWRIDAKAAYPVRYFLSESIPHWFRGWWGRVDRAFYKFKSLTYKKQHLLDMRSPEYGYDYGFCDKVALMVVAPFRLLEDFV